MLQPLKFLCIRYSDYVGLIYPEKGFTNFPLAFVAGLLPSKEFVQSRME